MNLRNQKLDETKGAELVMILLEEFMNIDFDRYYAMGQFEDQRPNKKLQFRHEFRFLATWLVFRFVRSTKAFSSIADVDSFFCRCFHSALEAHIRNDRKMLEIIYEESLDRFRQMDRSLGSSAGASDLGLLVSEKVFGHSAGKDFVFCSALVGSVTVDIQQASNAALQAFSQEHQRL